MRPLVCLFVFLSCLVPVISAQAQTHAPDGPDFPISTAVAGEIAKPSLAQAPDGSFVIVWEGERAGESPGSVRLEIRGRRGRNGQLLGEEFVIIGDTSGDQTAPAVDSAADGSFVVTWARQILDSPDSERTSIRARRFAANGTPLGEELPVHPPEDASQFSPSVAVGPDGRFIVAWGNESTDNPEINLSDIRARCFDAERVPLGPVLEVNAIRSDIQRQPAVALAPDGSFVIAWQSRVSAGADADGFSIQARRFDALCAPLGTEFQVNTNAPANQFFPALDVGPDGELVIAWESQSSSGTDQDGNSVQARRFGADGTPLGPEFQVNTLTDGLQGEPSVSIAPDRTFTIAWASQESNGSDRDGHSIQARRFQLGGTPLGPEFQVNTTIVSNQRDPAVALAPDGSMLFVWRNRASAELGPTSIRGQHLSTLADLRTSILSLPATVRPGERFGLVAAVQNQPLRAVARGVRVTVTVDERARILSAGASQGSCSGAGLPGATEARCNLFDLQPGEEAAVFLTTELREDATGAPLLALARAEAQNPELFVDNEAGVFIALLTDPPTPTPTGPTPTPVLPDDFDGDGVPDSIDQCGATQPGSFVNPFGCSSDKVSVQDRWWSFLLLVVALAFLLSRLEKKRALRTIPTAGLRSILLLGALVPSGVVLAQDVVRVGPELQINTTTDGNQLHPSVAFLPEDETVFVWQSFSSTSAGRGEPADDDGFSIQVRTFDASGLAFRDDFQANTDSAGDQLDPSIAARDAGTFIVAWTSTISAADTAGTSIHARTFDLQGGESEQFQVNTATVSNQLDPVVSAPPGSNPAGLFVVVWQSADQAPGTDIRARVFRHSQNANDLQPAPLGPDFRVNSTTAGIQRAPAVAMMQNGTFLVVWESEGSTHADGPPDTDGTSIQARLFNFNGQPLGEEFQVNTVVTGNQSAPSVSLLLSGGFFIAWSSESSRGSDDDGTSIQARRYRADGVPEALEMQINDLIAGDQSSPVVRAGVAGEILLIWESESSGDQEDARRTLRARALRQSGSLLGRESQIHTPAAGDQSLPALASSSRNIRSVAVWTSVGSSGLDLSGSSIHAQRLAPGPKLGVELSASSPETVIAGDSFDVLVTVRNAADAFPVQSGRMFLSVSKGAEFEAGSSPRSDCTTSSARGIQVRTVLTCEFSDLGPGESIPVGARLRAVLLKEDEVSVRAEVFLEPPDADDSDNAAELVLDVLPRDSDGDGVPDEQDECSDTTPGSFVDPRGCPGANLPALGGTNAPAILVLLAAFVLVCINRRARFRQSDRS